MSSAIPPAQPLQVLRDNITGLEAAVVNCLAKPRKKSVHQLRTATRRIEAQLQLLSLFDHIPSDSKQREKAERLLKQLRRAAGRVRDLDVQRDLLAEESSPDKHTPKPIVSEARDLRRALKRKRDAEADTLLKLLKKRETKFGDIFRDLLGTLEPAESLALTEPQLIAVVNDWYTRTRAHKLGDTPAEDNTDQLHSIRKDAKLARYLAESAPESATSARRIAAQFEALQQAGGNWHDFLLLSEVARNHLGKSAQLPQRFNVRAHKLLRIFERHIASLDAHSPEAAAPRKRGPWRSRAEAA